MNLYIKIIFDHNLFGNKYWISYLNKINCLFQKSSIWGSFYIWNIAFVYEKSYGHKIYMQSSIYFMSDIIFSKKNSINFVGLKHFASSFPGLWLKFCYIRSIQETFVSQWSERNLSCPGHRICFRHIAILSVDCN